MPGSHKKMLVLSNSTIAGCYNPNILFSLLVQANVNAITCLRTTAVLSSISANTVNAMKGLSHIHLIFFFFLTQVSSSPGWSRMPRIVKDKLEHLFILPPQCWVFIDAQCATHSCRAGDPNQDFMHIKFICSYMHSWHALFQLSYISSLCTGLHTKKI